MRQIRHTQNSFALMLIAALTFSCSSDSKFSAAERERFTNTEPGSGNENSFSEDRPLPFEEGGSAQDDEPGQTGGVAPSNIAGANLWEANCMSVQQKPSETANGTSSSENTTPDLKYYTACSLVDSKGTFRIESTKVDSILKVTESTNEKETPMLFYSEGPTSESRSLIFFKTNQFVEKIALAVPRDAGDNGFMILDVKVEKSIDSHESIDTREKNVTDFLSRFLSTPIDPAKVTEKATVRITASPDYIKELREKVAEDRAEQDPPGAVDLSLDREKFCSQTHIEKTHSVGFSKNDKKCVGNSSSQNANLYSGAFSSKQSIEVPSNAVICQVSVKSASNPKDFAHSDVFFLALNDFIVATNQLPSPELQQVRDGLQKYDWNKLKDQYFRNQDPNSSFPYCAPGEKKCRLPTPSDDDAIDIEVAFSVADTHKIVQPSDTSLSLSLHVLGDNDSDDCKHDESKFDVQIGYVELP